MEDLLVSGPKQRSPVFKRRVLHKRSRSPYAALLTTATTSTASNLDLTGPQNDSNSNVAPMLSSCTSSTPLLSTTPMTNSNLPSSTSLLFLPVSSMLDFDLFPSPTPTNPISYPPPPSLPHREYPSNDSSLIPTATSSAPPIARPPSPAPSGYTLVPRPSSPTPTADYSLLGQDDISIIGHDEIAAIECDFWNMYPIKSRSISSYLHDRRRTLPYAAKEASTSAHQGRNVQSPVSLPSLPSPHSEIVPLDGDEGVLVELSEDEKLSWSSENSRNLPWGANGSRNRGRDQRSREGTWYSPGRGKGKGPSLSPSKGKGKETSPEQGKCKGKGKAKSRGREGSSSSEGETWYRSRIEKFTPVKGGNSPIMNDTRPGDYFTLNKGASLLTKEEGTLKRRKSIRRAATTGEVPSMWRNSSGDLNNAGYNDLTRNDGPRPRNNSRDLRMSDRVLSNDSRRAGRYISDINAYSTTSDGYATTNSSYTHLDAPAPLGEPKDVEVDDEACFVDVQDVDGFKIDILLMLPLELALHILIYLCPPQLNPSSSPSHSTTPSSTHPQASHSRSHTTALHSVLACTRVSRVWRRLALDNSLWYALVGARWAVDVRRVASMSRLSKDVPYTIASSKQGLLFTAQQLFSAPVNRHAPPLILNWRVVYRNRWELEMRWAGKARVGDWDGGSVSRDGGDLDRIVHDEGFIGVEDADADGDIGEINDIDSDILDEDEEDRQADADLGSVTPRGRRPLLPLVEEEPSTPVRRRDRYQYTPGNVASSSHPPRSSSPPRSPHSPSPSPKFLSPSSSPSSSPPTSPSPILPSPVLFRGRMYARKGRLLSESRGDEGEVRDEALRRGKGAGPNGPSERYVGGVSRVSSSRAALAHGVVSEGAGAGASLWEPTVTRISGHADSVYCLDFDSRRIITGSRDRTLKVWSLRTGRLLGTLGGAHKGSVLCLKFEKDWEFGGADGEEDDVGGDGGAGAYDAGAEDEKLDDEREKKDDRAASRRKGFLVSGSSDCTVCVWDLRVETQKAQGQFGERGRWTTEGIIWEESVGDGCNDSDNESAAVHNSTGNQGLNEDTTECVVTGQVRAKLQGHTGGVLDLRIDSRWIVSCSKDTLIRVWDRKTLRLHRTLKGHDGPVNAVGLQGGQIVSASGDGKMILWDIESGQRIRTFDGHDRGLACIDFKNDLLISGSNDCTIKVWNAVTGRCVRTLVGHEALVRALAVGGSGAGVRVGLDVSSVGKGAKAKKGDEAEEQVEGRLVSTSYDKSVKVWDLANGTLVREFKGTHTSQIFDVKFDVSRIVSTSHDRKIVVLDFSAGLDVSVFV